MRKKMQFNWEHLDECTQRAAVIGGWLILRLGAVDAEKGKKITFRESMTFVPDHNHDWTIVPATPATTLTTVVNKAADFAP